MFVLALDSATLAASAAVISTEKLIAERFINTKLTHSETLLPVIQQTLVDAGITPKDIGGIAVTCGPGSFTGLRIGLATAKGLAQVLECPLVGIPTLDALAYNLVGNKGLICPILDARKQQVYTALYRTNPSLERLTDYQALSIVELVSLIQGYPEHTPVTFLGDGVAVYAQILQQALGARALLAPRALNSPRAAAVAELGIRRITAGEDDHWSKLSALYLRASEAETTWAKRHRCSEER